ncbi:heteromeric transposase endonuclease subunit TnsA [Desulfitobacterium metallireducens]|uniref:Tn7 transposition protein A n=1 Tax=Desulfitobacterium metallireducens DSM 15288 TaxID=871968 RepID=W0E9D3_9FIRM|nr:heteromeric transposase endonuclease subunit TnsA [Desulfitobacterium metallireducens]AHF05824.1 Tn7 transposition protein A [Desulfitobacterium metallireducens DSM 15288]
MAKRNRTTTERKKQIRINEGRGQGEGSDYIPWLKIQDVPSLGTVSRVKGWKTGRTHHLMSRNNELMYFYLLEWSPIVTDIREQYPLLPIERTLEIAESFNIEHPKDPHSKENIVMTTDFMITVDRGNGRELWARTIKPVEDLGKRVLEKFRIEHKFYEEQGIDWGIVTNQVIPRTLALNIEKIHDAYWIDNHGNIDEKIISLVAPTLFNTLKDSSLTLSKEALLQDKVYGFESGTCLFIVKHMLARKRWFTDMNNDINFNSHLQLDLKQQRSIDVG